MKTNKHLPLIAIARAREFSTGENHFDRRSVMHGMNAPCEFIGDKKKKKKTKNGVR